MRKILVLSFLPIFVFARIFAQSPFGLEKKRDIALLGTGIVLSGADLVLDNVLEVNRQEFGGIGDKSGVNRLDRFFMRPYWQTGDTISDCTLALSMLTPAALLAAEKSEWKTSAVMYAETLLIANGVKELLKLAVNRNRPYTYYEDYPESAAESGDFANSFPSGHSTMAFAGATFATYTFFKYFPESAWRIPVAAGSFSLAISTAALRVRSGKHFLTDVATGALLGGSIGFLVPWLHTFNEKGGVQVNAGAGELSFRFQL